MKKINYYGIIGLVIALIVMIIFFKVPALRLALAFIVLFYPLYSLLGYFIEDTVERVILSFFLGVSVLVIVMWFVNRIIPSLTLSLFITFLLLIISLFWLHFWKKKTEQ